MEEKRYLIAITIIDPIEKDISNLIEIVDIIDSLDEEKINELVEKHINEHSSEIVYMDRIETFYKIVKELDPDETLEDYKDISFMKLLLYDIELIPRI